MKKYFAVIALLLLTNLSANTESDKCDAEGGAWQWNGTHNLWECIPADEVNRRIAEINKCDAAGGLWRRNGSLDAWGCRLDDESKQRAVSIKMMAAQEAKIKADKEAESKRIAAENLRVAAENERIEAARQAVCNSNWKAKLDGLSGVEKIKFYSEVKNLGCR